jgi:hypothetical protein
MTHSHAARPRPTAGLRLRVLTWWILGTVAVVIVAAFGWVGVRALLAKGELEKAVPLASTIQSQITDGDAAGADRTFAELSRRADSAAELSGDPIWRSFEVLPWIGPNLAVFRELAGAVNDVSQNAVRPLTGLAGSLRLNDFKPAEGALDVQPLVVARPHVAAASDALERANKLLRGIDTTRVLSPLRDAAGQLKSAVSKAAGTVHLIDRAVRILPAMLGDSGPRNYILLFQNPAELRATGGIPGAVALLHTEHGRIELVQQAAASDFERYDSPALSLPDETRALYGAITGQYMQDVNLTPNFPLSAQLAREMWTKQFGTEADGVISIDPVALSYLLKATGPIALPTGDVMTADNAVQLLLSDVYARYERPSDQDDFFAAAAASVFSAVSGGTADPKALIEALAEAGSEHRVLVWSAHEEDQAVLADTTLAGGLPRSDAETNRFGVYLNDATGAKMDMYLDVKVGVGQVTCRKDERPNYGVSVTLTNTAPADAAITLSDYVTGGGAFNVPPGNVKTLVSVYGGPGMQNLGMTRDGAAVGYHPATDSTHPVSLVSVELAPGETTVLTFGWLGPKAFAGELVIQSTPVIHRHETAELALTCESPLW